MPRTDPGRRSDRAATFLAWGCSAAAAAQLVVLDVTRWGRWPLPLAWPAAACWWWLLRRPAAPGRQGPAAPAHRAWAAGGAAVGLLLPVGAWLVLNPANGYIGHDEAVYATLARSWTGPLPSAGVAPYRPIGISALGAVLFVVSESPGPGHGLTGLRVLALLLAIGALGALLQLGRSVTTPGRAAAAVLTFGAAAAVQRRIPEFLGDLPSTGLLLLVLAQVLRAVRTGRGGPLLAAAAIGVAACYVRYGSLTALAAIGAGALAAEGPRAWWQRRGQVAAAAAVLGAGLLPAAVRSWRLTGTPWGIVIGAQQVADRGFPGQGLLTYLVWAPFRLAGDVGGVLLLAAVWGLVAAVRRPRLAPDGQPDAERRWIVLLGATAAAEVLVLGAGAHAEERYVFLPVALGCLIGVHVLAEAATERGSAITAAVAGFALLTAPASTWFDQRQLRQLSAERAPLATAAGLAAEPSGRPCTVAGPRWGPSLDPEVGWYSGCAVQTVREAARAPLPPGTVLRRGGADADRRVDSAIARWDRIPGRPVRVITIGSG